MQAMISPEHRNRLVENNKKISRLLEENEKILRECGYTPPISNFALNADEKIKFPAGYIRRVNFFDEKYHLKEIFPNKEVRHNVIYTLEVSDLINYLFNRINVWGPVSTILYKLAIVNIVSIIEAIVLEAANNICSQANCCGKVRVCATHFSREERSNVRKALEKLTEIKVIDFDREKLSRIQEIIDLRNRIHIRLANGNELKLSDFNLELYNEVIAFLQTIDEQVYKNAVPIYCREQ